MTHITKKLILSVILIFSISLACRIPTFGQQPTPTAEVEQPVFNETIDELGDILSTDPATGNTVITVSEAQLNQMITEKMAGEDVPMLIDPLVTLQNEKIGITGKTNQAGMDLNVNIRIAVGVDLEGQLVIDIESVKIGPFEAPTSVKDSVSALIVNLFNTTIGNDFKGLKMESVSINNGLMVITLKPN